jgi:excisionase family DNA binding protein
MAINDESVDSMRSSISPLDIDSSSLFLEPLWTVEDVAEYFKLQPETIRSMARRGELPAIKIGKVWRFQWHTIHEMLINMY